MPRLACVFHSGVLRGLGVSESTSGRLLVVVI